MIALVLQRIGSAAFTTCHGSDVDHFPTAADVLLFGGPDIALGVVFVREQCLTWAMRAVWLGWLAGTWTALS